MIHPTGSFFFIVTTTFLVIQTLILMGQTLWSKLPERIRRARTLACSFLRPPREERGKHKKAPDADQVGVQIMHIPAAFTPQESSSSASVMDEAMEELRERISEADMNSCKDSVLILFEDICPQHLDKLAQQYAFQSDAIVAAILDQQERGIQYPRRENPKKRKRNENRAQAADGGDNAIKARINDPEYGRQMHTAQYKEMATRLISQDFPKVPINTIKNKLAENGFSVFRAYTTIDDAFRTWDEENPPWQNKKTTTKVLEKYTPDNIANLDLDELTGLQRAALDEFRAARTVRNGKDAEKAAEIEELRNIERAREEGELSDCGCCFEEFPLNRMVHCEGDDVHWFCRNCMKQQAETTIGYSKYELSCLSMDGCSAGFSVTQRRVFLDDKLQIALDRIEQQAMLRLAGIENLETCPFCPFAMEYPPVEENKEFRCANSECEIVSCRLCRKKTHIPKTCAEAATEEGHSARHTIEEAMSEAVIRKCNKCANPFIKQDGCNKITCTRCHTIHCYVCRETVKDYSHFNDVNRGGKQGQCPLFDATEERHQNEVQRAEEETRSKVAKENPELNAEVLQFKVSAKVREDESRRKRQEPPILVRGRMRRFWAPQPEMPPEVPPGPNVVMPNAERHAADGEQYLGARLAHAGARQIDAQCRARAVEPPQPGIRQPRVPHYQRYGAGIAPRIAMKVARDDANAAARHLLQQPQAIPPNLQAPNPPPAPRLEPVFPVAQIPQPVRVRPIPGLVANNPIMVDQPEAERPQAVQMPLDLDALFFPPMVDRDLDMFMGMRNLQPLQDMLNNGHIPPPPNHMLIDDEIAAVNRMHEQMLRGMRLGNEAFRYQGQGPNVRYGPPAPPRNRARDRPVVSIPQPDGGRNAAIARVNSLRAHISDQQTPAARARGARA